MERVLGIARPTVSRHGLEPVDDRQPAVTDPAEELLAHAQPETLGEVRVVKEMPYRNVIDAASDGASQGMTLALNVAAMLIAFLAFIAMFDYILQECGGPRLAILLGVPPFLVGLLGATGSLTYFNIEQLFGFHDRSSLRPKAAAVMSALDSWALPGPQTLELNRDDYTRPSLGERAKAYKIMIEAGVMTPDEARAMEHSAAEFYARAAARTSDAATRKLLGDLAAAEVGHEQQGRRARTSCSACG